MPGFIRRFLPLLLSLGIPPCGRAEEHGVCQAEFQGFPVRVEWTLPEPVPGLAASVTGEIRRIEALLSPDDGPGLGRLNRGAGGPPVAVPEDLFELLVRTREISRLTNGGVDPAYGAVTRLWNFSPRSQPAKPSRDAVRIALLHRGIHHAEFENGGHTVQLPAGMRLDLEPFASGFAADRLVDLLRGAGATQVRAQFSSVIKHWGSADGPSRDHVVQDPRRPAWPVASIRVENRALADASGEQRVIVVDGERFHHILDPRTGWPASGCRRAVVLAPRAEFAQGMSRALMTMVPEDAIRLISRIPGADALVIGPNGRVLTTPGITPAPVAAP